MEIINNHDQDCQETYEVDYPHKMLRINSRRNSE